MRLLGIAGVDRRRPVIEGRVDVLFHPRRGSLPPIELVAVAVVELCGVVELVGSHRLVPVPGVERAGVGDDVGHAADPTLAAAVDGGVGAGVVAR